MEMYCQFCAKRHPPRSKLVTLPSSLEGALPMALQPRADQSWLRLRGFACEPTGWLCPQTCEHIVRKSARQQKEAAVPAGQKARWDLQSAPTSARPLSCSVDSATRPTPSAHDPCSSTMSSWRVPNGSVFQSCHSHWSRFKKNGLQF